MAWKSGAAAAALVAAIQAAHPASLEISPEEVRAILAAAAPYRIPLEVAGVPFFLDCGNPRDLALGEGRLRLRLSCTGRPVPLAAELRPEITVARDPESNGFRAVFARLPIRIPWVGEIDLRDYLPPLEIPDAIRMPIDPGDSPRLAEIRIREIRVHPAGISARLEFGVPGAEAPSPAPGSLSE